MLIFVTIAVGWLAVVAMCASLCRVAARAGDARPLDSQLDARPVLEQLAKWESLSQPAVRDTRRASEEREAVALASP